MRKTPSGKRNVRSGAHDGNNVNGKGNSAVNAATGKGIETGAGTVIATETVIVIVTGTGAEGDRETGQEVGTGASVGTPKPGTTMAARRM